MVLNGEDGVTVQLHGETFISKQGITSSDVRDGAGRAVLELRTEAAGAAPNPALAAHGNLCKQKLAMPTEFVGQNGAVIKQSTKIAVTGCGKAVRTKHKKRARHKQRSQKAKKGR